MADNIYRIPASNDKLVAVNSNINYGEIATEQKKQLDKYEEVLKYLVSGSSSSTPIPVTDKFRRYPTEKIQLPRYAYHINPEWYHYMRMDSITLRTVVLKIKQEIFRETSKDGFLWEQKFDYKCNICGMEYQEEVQICEDCQGQSFTEAINRQKSRLDRFLVEANSAEQTLLEVLHSTEDDLNTHDDLYLIIAKDYFMEGTEVIGIPLEIYRGDPKLFRIVADEKGRRGGIWICPKHRTIGAMQPGVCQQPDCDWPLQAVHYAESEAGGPDAAMDTEREVKYKYYIKGEVIHASKYEPTSLYGTSPIYTLWVVARTLVTMDIYVQKLYEKGRKKGILTFNTDNFDSIKAMLDETDERLQNDPHHIAAFGIQHETGRGKAEFIKITDTLAEMNYIPAKEMMNRQIAAIYGVMPIFQADLSTSGGLNNEGLQITVTDRAVDFGQSIYHNKVFPKLLQALGITDWNLKLRPSRETDEMSELQRWHQQIESARVGAELGLEVVLKEGVFEYSGTATSPTQQSAPSPFFPPSQPGQQPSQEDETDLDSPCPPGKHRTAENPKCHPIEWDLKQKANLTKSNDENYLVVKCQESTFQQELKEAQDPNHKLFWTINKVKVVGDPQKATNLYFETKKGIMGFFKIKGYGQERYRGQIQSVVYFDRDFTSKPTLTKAQESGRKLSTNRNKIEQQFTKNITKLYTKLYFKRLEAAPETLSKKVILAEIDESTEKIQEPIEKEGWLEVNRAYFKGKNSVENITKEMAPDWLNWNKLPYSKSDNAVLKVIYADNPFWDAFSNLTQSISDKFKEIITESYMAPTESAFRAELKNVQDDHPDASKERQLKITYGRVGKSSLSQIIAKMKEVVIEDVYRLERIARTETTAITAKGREQSFNETDPEKKGRYEWFGPIDSRTSDECREIQRQVQTAGGGKGVPLAQLKDIMKSVVNKANRTRRSKWAHRDWSPHANCRRVIRRVV